MKHFIKKQIIDLKVDKQLDAFSMQHLLSEQYWHDILPSLNKLFDDISSEDEIIEIDKLEIDLGVFSVKEIEQNEWCDILLSKINEQISDKSKPESLKSIVREPKSISVCRQWMFYIENGHLPWNTPHISESWKQGVLEALAVDFKMVSKLRFIIMRNSDAATRIFLQHEEDFLRKLTEILTAENQGNLIQSLEEVYELFQWIDKQKKNLQPLAYKKEFQQKLWKQVLNRAASGDKDLTTEKLIIHIIQPYKMDIAENKKIPVRTLRRLKILGTAIRQLSEDSEDQKEKKTKPGKTYDSKKIKDNSDKQRGNNTKELQKKEQVSPQTQINEQPFDIDIIADKKNEIPERLIEGTEEFLRTETTKIFAEGIFVQNAGIVLLHPFLNSFFQRLKLVIEEKFVDLYSQKKAIHLLHYLATGNTEAEEYELVVPKVLCGLSIQVPVEKYISLTDDELYEAGNMLGAAIQQWEKLKNTSAAGMREGFLQRNGKLLTKNDNLYIHVESQSIDVLLDYLPWSLSMIKLPWLKEILRVEWR